MLQNVALVIVLNVFIDSSESVQVDSKELEVDQVEDYANFDPVIRKDPAHIRENFLHDIKEKDIIRDFERIISNNTVYVDGIPHYETVPGWIKVKEIENEFKDLLTMQYMKYVYQRDTHWRTWRVIEDDDGQKKVVCYKCQSMIHENCTECDGRGTWVIEEGLPPCPYEIFHVVTGNELCAVNYSKLNEKLPDCPTVIKYADLTKSCNNPIVTRWRFTRNYKVPGRNSSYICGGRDFCEVLTLYQIKPDYVVFRIVDLKNNIIFSRVMRNFKKNYVCTNNCGNINMTDYKVVQNSVANLKEATLLSSKKKRNSVTKKENFKSKKHRYDLKKPVKRTHSKNEKPKVGIPFANNTKTVWIRKDTGYFVKEVPIATTTHKSKCKKLVERNLLEGLESNDNEINVYDYYDSPELRKKFITFN